MPSDIGHVKPTVNRLVNMIEEGGVKIPPLQRPFVWKVNQIVELLESINDDYPIGSILCWETSDHLPAEGLNAPVSSGLSYYLNGPSERNNWQRGCSGIGSRDAIATPE